MTDILLNYAMPSEKVTPLLGADLGFLHNALVLVKPKDESVARAVVECLSTAEVQNLTNAKAYEMLDAGMSSIYVLPTDSLDLSELDLSNYGYYTIIIDEAFTKEEVEARDFGEFGGVVSYMSTDRDYIKSFNLQDWNAGFYGKIVNGAVNMYRSFGKLLSAFSWKNQQYIEMEADDDITTLNEANVLFEAKANFVLNSPRYGRRLALFSAGNKAIVAPYIYEEICNNIQGWGLQYINLNQPDYTVRDAKLMQEFIQNKLNTNYVNKGLVPSATCNIKVVDGSNFVATGGVVIGEPKALWRVETTVQQGEI